MIFPRYENLGYISNSHLVHLVHLFYSLLLDRCRYL